jgi:hypothetical protein
MNKSERKRFLSSELPRLPAESQNMLLRYEATVIQMEDLARQQSAIIDKLKGDHEAAILEIKRLSDAIGFYARNWDTWGRIAKLALGFDSHKRKS